MIYLFNSAFRAKYKSNILNTLFLPTGCVNEYRYRTATESQHVDPALLNGNHRNKSVAIIYIDRHGTINGKPEFVFHPLRRGRLISLTEDNEQAFIRIGLEEFVYPNDLAGFQKVLRTTIGARLPTMVENDPEKPAQGFFALEGTDVLVSSQTLPSDAAWAAAVEAVAKTKSFAAPNRIVFIRCNVKSPKTWYRAEKELRPVLKGNSASFALTSDSPYEMVLTYRFPLQRQDANARVGLKIDCGPAAIPQSKQDLSFDASSSRNDFRFQVRKYVEEKTGKIDFAFPSEEDANGVTVSIDHALTYHVAESQGFWVKIAVLLLLFSTTSVLMSVELDAIRTAISVTEAPDWTSYLVAIFNYKHLWIKLLAALVQAIVLYLLFRVVGKKVL